VNAGAPRHVDAERLSAWISGELSDRDIAVVRRHVEACPDCAEVTVALRAQVVATRTLERPEPPATLWSAIEGALDAPPGPRRWSWGASLIGALAGASMVMLVGVGLGRLRGRQTPLVSGQAQAEAGAGSGASASASARASPQVGLPGSDPLLAEAERELEQAAVSYERAVGRLRTILDREQLMWDPETRARVGDRLARLDEAVAHSRAVARRDPGDSTGADMLFSAYQRQIDFLAEAVHRGSPAAEEGVR